MEDTLRKNADKGGWDECSLLWLQAKLTEEVGELGKILVNEIFFPDGRGDRSTHEQVIRAALFEAVDIANVALMLADRIQQEQSPS
jgi:hypothetical protein